MSVVSSDFRIPNDNRPHIKVDIVHSQKMRTVMYGLIDTGAQSCCITNEKATELNLPVLSKEKIQGSAGEMITNRYAIESILLPGGIVHKTEGIIGYEKCGGTADIILGMDLIGKGFLSLSFDGRMLIAF